MITIFIGCITFETFQYNIASEIRCSSLFIYLFIYSTYAGRTQLYKKKRAVRNIYTETTITYLNSSTTILETRIWSN